MAFGTITASNGTTGALGNTLSWLHTVAEGSDRILVVGLTTTQAAAPIPESAVTFNTVSMTRVTSRYWTTEGNHQLELFVLVNPATGEHEVSITANGGVLSVGGGAISFDGAHQSTPCGTPGEASGVADALQVTGIASAADELVVDVAACEWSASELLTADASQTGHWETIWSNTGDGNRLKRRIGMSTKTGAASVTMQWTGQDTLSGWGIIAVPVKPAAASSTTWLRHRA